MKVYHIYSFCLIFLILINDPKAQSLKEQIDKLDFITTENIWSSKDLIKRKKRQARDLEKALTNHILY